MKYVFGVRYPVPMASFLLLALVAFWSTNTGSARGESEPIVAVTVASPEESSEEQLQAVQNELAEVRAGIAKQRQKLLESMKIVAEVQEQVINSDEDLTRLREQVKEAEQHLLELRGQLEKGLQSSVQMESFQASRTSAAEDLKALGERERVLRRKEYELNVKLNNQPPVSDAKAE